MLRLAVAVLLLAGVVLADVPVFPTDWTSIETDFAVIYQGDYTVSNGMYCCGDTNCNVQTEYQSGHNYFDYTNKRTRFDDPVQGSIVSLYSIGKEMEVDGNNVCQAYCPIDDELDPYSIPSNATDQGSTIINDTTVEDWQYKELFLGIIVMETDDFYVDQSQSPAIPVQEVDQLTPFGEKIGEFTSNYLSFIAGTPDPSHFDIKGISNCPQAQNCDDNKRQLHRLRYKNKRAWLKSYQNLKLKKAGKF
jgi:hypothetical protein